MSTEYGCNDVGTLAFPVREMRERDQKDGAVKGQAMPAARLDDPEAAECEGCDKPESFVLGIGLVSHHHLIVRVQV